MKTLDVTPFAGCAFAGLEVGETKTGRGGLSGWLLTTVTRPPSACMGTATGDGGQHPTWGMESVPPFFVIFTKFLFFLMWCFPKSRCQDIAAPFLQEMEQKGKKDELCGCRGRRGNDIAEGHCTVFLG